MSRPARVGVIAIVQESNTFLPRDTTLADYQQDTLLGGEEVRRRFADAHHEVGGFFAGLAAAGLEAVPVFAARAMPYGTMTSECRQGLLARLDAQLDRAGPLDGLLLAPHGATVAADQADFDGGWVSHVRRRFPHAPIAATLDLHANVSPRLIAAADAWVAYRTNPHLDQRACGMEAAGILACTLRGEVRPTTAAEFLPLVVNIERQLTADEPCRSLVALADEVRHRPGVLAVSLLLGFPYADVPQLGTAVTVTTDNNPAAAHAAAAEIASYWWQRREAFRGELVSIDDALARAARGPWPVGLLDMGDNVGGGSPGDGTLLAAALERQGLAPSFALLFDPEAVQRCQQAGLAARLSLSIGGHCDLLHGAPLEREVVVRGLHDGRFEETEARHGGMLHYDQGPTAVVETDGGLTLMLTSRRMAPFSIRQMTSFGVDPAQFRYVVIKGVHAPVAAYAPYCRQLIRVNTPGVTTADMGQLTFHHRRRPLYPFEPSMSWQPQGSRPG